MPLKWFKKTPQKGLPNNENDNPTAFASSVFGFAYAGPVVGD
jgi:hypothetical protein